MAENHRSDEKVNLEEITAFLLDTGAFLMSSGAHSGRVWRNCNRIASHWGYRMNFNPTYTGILMTVWHADHPDRAVTRYQSSPQSNIHMAVLSQISHLSWQIADGEVSFRQSRHELENIRSRPHYSYWVVALAVGFSCGLLSMLAGGDIIDLLFAFVAAFLGSLTRYYVLRNQFNILLAVIAAAFVSSFIAGCDTVYSLGKMPEIALATSVLYLIPGVPLLNSVIDLLEGYLGASMARSLFAASVLLCIAIGMTLTITLLGIGNF